MSSPISDPIYVTRPSLPPLDEFMGSLREIWDSHQLTNNGPFHQRFEAALAKHLGVSYVSLFCNGTVALQVGLQALEVTGEVITTPFTFPATTHAIHWNHCRPVFCDIEPTTCNLDADKLEELITPNTSCILPVHVYGNPCDVHRLQEIATEHRLKLFYDAAHAFGVKLNGESVLNFGDLSMLSFHATKVFNTVEGGALITNDPQLKQRIDYLKNFGFANETSVIAPGINGKMNELQAAYGMLQLKYVGAEIDERRQLTEVYRRGVTGIPGLRFLHDVPGVTHNYSYFPVFVDGQEYGTTRDDLCARLRKQGICARRYFYPLVSDFVDSLELVRPPARLFEFAPALADQVLCLPLYGQLDFTSVERVLQLLADRP
jgi:dTDP-4-amino-4,6-dideoxygalactose transaminase